MENLIELRQLPIIVEYLSTQKEKWEQDALEAEAMVCTEATLKAVKGKRTEIGQEFEDLERRRKEVKAAIMARYNAFDAVYKDCITVSYQRAYASLTEKINEVESDIKARCEDGLRDYFAELCAVHHLDWLTYEQAGIKVDMASAKAKTPKKLREQLSAFVAGVAESVDRINTLEDAGEIMVEYQKTLDAAGAICTVKERHRRIEEQKKFQEARDAIRAQEAEAVRRVEALAPPVVVESPGSEKTVRVSLVMHPTRSQYEDKIKPIMRKLKEICDMEGIKYE